MFFDFNQKSSLLLIFFFNGIIFSFLLFKRAIAHNHNPSKWLGWFVMLSTLYISPFMFGYGGWYSKKLYREILFFIPFQQLFLLGPIIYFYTQSLLNKTFRLEKRDLIHFLPAALYMVYTIIIFVTDKLILEEYYFYADGKDKDLAFWYQIAGLLSMLSYLLLSLRYYFIYKNLAYQEVSFADAILFKWIGHFLFVFTAILVLRVLFFILNPEWWEFGSKFWYYLCFSVLFFYIALSGYFNTVRAPFALDTSLLDYPRKTNLKKEMESSKLKHSQQTEIPDLEEWKSKITKFIEQEGLYTNPNLTLTDVASSLQTNRNLISKAINQGFQMNFNDYVNAQRVDAVISKFRSGQQNSKTLLGIALDCGFNSKSTFNRAFKKKTLLTPKDFLDKKGVK
ncbi:helix-turn-helix transcriptional regulator [Subsaximicrobium wynnwilliamsii]|uniref:Helix-turn-helix transcriptional regulator n=2 Tax=Subsaximicrobium wynnwilliamsii TaxID=291179 RepID=A0A5C6ZCC4_9FLAO|nr:helix-turn-helix transcriptional regulator [Subsaximicrobium wynnwilliamsii]TXD87164.1 helix-turn-helix transcriptional regulator [Subsaximicrobium wynnwilliamsii]TXE00857.1 helix-turn-helix transcriptional regulator [Subsaximicrobium wynnwilliamsii]